MSVRKTKAAVLETINAPLVVEELEIPDLEYGQVLVRIYSTGICGKQLGQIAGLEGEDPFLPHLLGHEGGGVIVEIGGGVSKVKEGEHVVVHWRKGTGIEGGIPRYKRSDGIVTSGFLSTFNEYAVVSENRVTAIPDDIPFEVAALMGCAVTTGLGLVNNDAKVKLGESAAVMGCGGVGMNVIQGLAMVSAYPIIAIDISESKLSIASEMGATHTINPNESDVREEIQKILGSKKLDVFVECTGLVSLIELAYDLTTPAGGRTVLVGRPKFDQDLTIHSFLSQFGGPDDSGKILKYSQGGQTVPELDIPRYIRLYRQGKIKLDSLITHRYRLEDINSALDEIRKGDVGRCLISMD